MQKENSKVKAVAWTVPPVSEKTFSFCMQVTGITRKNKKKVIRSLEGWRLNGDGYNFKTKKELVICYREFKTKAAFKKWAKTFPYAVWQHTEKTDKLKKINKIG